MTVSRFLLRLRRKVRQQLPEPVTQLFQKGTSYMQLITQTFPGGATLTGWVHARVESCPSFDKRPAVLILPGGGYDYCSQREGEPVALQFLAAGYQAFVLEYSTAQKAANWQPMIDAARAMVWLRSNAGQLNLMPNKIAVCGFSAGGHLAASTAILWDATPVQEALGKERGKNCPNAVILGYPVVTSGEFATRAASTTLPGMTKPCGRPSVWKIRSGRVCRPSISGIRWPTPACRWKIRCCWRQPCAETVFPLRCTCLPRDITE